MSEVDASAAATAAWTAENEEEEPEPDVPYALMGMAAAALSNDEDSPSDVEADFERPVVTLGFDDNSFATLPAHAFEASLPSSSGASEFGDFQDGESTCAWAADFEEEPPRLPPLEEEEVTLIKETMKSLNIRPPAWVQRMQQVQRIQAALGKDADQASLNEAWRLQVQQTAGPGVLPEATVLQASPLLAMPAAASSIGGVAGPKRVTAKQLAAERRALRAKVKAERERQREEEVQHVQ